MRSTPFKKFEYDEYYAAMKNSGSKNIARDVVNRQAQVNSTAQARIIKKAAEKLGLKENFRKLRYQQSEAFWDIIRNAQKELRDQGYSNEEIRERIGKTYFDS